MLSAGIHFGNHASRWNPKMKPYIYGKREKIHIIDIRETVRGLLRAQKFVTRVVAAGRDVLFVGTKRQSRDIVREHAARCEMHSVTERWLGGTLTNFRTIRSRLKRLEELENLVASPEWESGYSKKMKSTLSRELRKIQRNLTGIRNMTALPGVIVAVDVRKETNALREARSLNIPTICLIDTDGDPDFVSIPIPGNDDGMRAIELVINRMADAVEEGKRARPEPKPTAQTQNETALPARRRTREPEAAPAAQPAEAFVPGDAPPVVTSAAVAAPAAEQAQPAADESPTPAS